MAKIRYAVLENDKTEASSVTSGTKTVDLPETGILSELSLLTRSKGAYTDNTILPHYLAIQKIEVLVDGSTVVKSLSGRQVRALMYYNKGPFANTSTYYGVDNHNAYYNTFTTYFGKFAGDTKQGLDLSQYSNPQLKFTFDLASTSYDGVSYDVNETDPSFTYSVIAKLFDGSPAGFTNRYMQSREIDSYTVGASQEHGTEIPRGFDLYGLVLDARYKSVNWYEFFNHVKLDFDNGRWVPIDADYESLVNAYKTWFPEPCEHVQLNYCANGDDFDAQVMHIDGFAWGSDAANVFQCGISGQTLPLSPITIRNHDGSPNTTAQAWTSFVSGWGPMQTLYIPMSELIDGATDIVKTTDYGRIDLKVKTGAGVGSSAVSRVVAEYLKPNGV